MQEDKEAFETTATREDAPDLWDKIKQGAARLGDKISSVAGDAAESAKTALTGVVSRIKTDKNNDRLFRQQAELFLREDGGEIYAVRDESERSLTLRDKDAVKHLELLGGPHGKVIVIAEGEKRVFPFILGDAERGEKLDCYKTGYLAAYSEKLNPAKQVLIYNSFHVLDKIVENYRPTLFKRSRYAALKADYEKYRSTVLSGGDDVSLYDALAGKMSKLIPAGTATLNAVRLQLL